MQIIIYCWEKCWLLSRLSAATLGKSEKDMHYLKFIASVKIRMVVNPKKSIKYYIQISYLKGSTRLYSFIW